MPPLSAEEQRRAPAAEGTTRSLVSRDAIAGISVALMLVPQSLAFASLVGLPAQHGLWASILPPIAAAFFASSPYLQTGPTAMTSLMTLGALTAVVAPSGAGYAQVAALLALLVGLIRIAFGIARWGWLAYLVSQPVMSGFTSGSAVLIVLSQLPIALGASTAGGAVSGALWTLLHPATWDPVTTSVSFVACAIVLGGRRVHPLFPGVLIALVLGIVFSQLTGYEGAKVGAIPGGLPPLRFDLPWHAARQLVVPALIIALVGFTEPASIARTYAAQDRRPWSPDRELVSQGVANLASAVSGGFPVGGSFSRTAVNRLAGVRTRWGGAFAGLFILAFLPFAPLISPLPKAVLSAIVIAAVMKVVEVRNLFALARFSLLQAFVGWLTFGLTLLLNPRVDEAVMIALGFAVAVHVWRELPINVRARFTDGTLTLEPQGVLFFASAPRLEEALIKTLSEHAEATRLVLDLEELGRIDYTGALSLMNVVEEAHAAGLDVRLVHVPAHAQRILSGAFGVDAFDKLTAAIPGKP